MKTETQIDEILAASFPASDPPPWTLGVETEPRAKQRAWGDAADGGERKLGAEERRD